MTKTSTETVIISHCDLERTAVDALTRVGVPEGHAIKVAQALVDADMRGVGTHGVKMLPLYLKKIGLGLINPKATIREVHTKGSVAVLDGDNGLGQLAAIHGMERAVELAMEHAVGVTVLRRTNHAGCLAHYPLLAADRGLIGFITTIAARNMAPWGGVEPLLGNNPFAIAFPTPGEFNIVLDMAASVVSKGRVRLAAERGETIPEGWAVTASGEPLTDPRAFVESGAGAFLLAPIGGAKGSGMAIINALLAGVLARTDNLGLDVPSLTKTFDKVVDTGLFIQVIDVHAFGDYDQYLHRMTEFVARIRDSRPAQGHKQVLLPGEPEYLTKLERSEEGIPIAKTLWVELQGSMEGLRA